VTAPLRFNRLEAMRSRNLPESPGTLPHRERVGAGAAPYRGSRKLPGSRLHLPGPWERRQEHLCPNGDR
jgi:hypothetical protein